MSSKFLEIELRNTNPKKGESNKTSVIRTTNQSLQVSEKLAGEVNILLIIFESKLFLQLKCIINMKKLKLKFLY